MMMMMMLMIYLFKWFTAAHNDRYSMLLYAHN